LGDEPSPSPSLTPQPQTPYPKGALRLKTKAASTKRGTRQVQSKRKGGIVAFK